jgi:probable F420-dependent oxidoreductase
VSFAVSVQAGPRDRDSWLALAVKAEAAGFEGLYVGDHPGVTADPFVALAAAAAVTERIRLGTCVLNAGMWEPIALANAVATVDLISQGRAVLGVGTGHTPQEWTARGLAFPAAGARVARMVELIEATYALLSSTEAVSYTGDHVTLDDAALTDPRPVQDRIPLMVGGNGDRVLRLGAEHADIVGITGAGRTLEDGHRHEVDWAAPAIERAVDVIRSTAAKAGRDPQLEALVQHVEVTDDASAAAARLVAHVPGASEAELLSAPFAWVGTVDEIRGQLRRHEDELGLRRYVVRPPAIRHVREVLGDALAWSPSELDDRSHRPT